MGQAVWSGSITFGLVNIPVRLYPATQPKDVRFHFYDRRTGKRVRYERVTRDEEAASFEPEVEIERGGEPESEEPEERTARDLTRPAPEPPSAQSLERAQPVERDDLVRGVQLEGGDIVTVSDEELVSIAPERSRSIAIEEFVDLAEIDPVFFEKSYHVAPVRGMGAEKPYALLLRAMQGAGMAGIGRFVLRTKPHLVAIRALKDALALETLFFGDEVRSSADVAWGVRDLAVSERELKIARQLIGAMAAEWVPERHADEYREELLDLLRSKPAAKPAEYVAAESPVGDLMAALRASVEAAKRQGAKKTAKRSAKGA